MEVIVPLEEMTVAEKLRLIDTIWADLAKREEEVPSPQWHGEVLRERETAVAAGTSKFKDWEEVKQSLFERFG